MDGGTTTRAAARKSALAADGGVWAETPLRSRLRVIERIRHAAAERANDFVDAMPSSLARNRADTLAAEVLPLLEACKFLEREATRLLAPQPLGKHGLPFWLSGVDATVERVPLGVVLIIAPANYPLFLPGVQALQALAAGNAVVWKPGRGGRAVAEIFAELAHDAGLPGRALRVTDEAVETVHREIEASPDKIVFTGSSETGKTVQRLAAEYSIPVVAELSGCDAVIVLPGADEARVLDALCFGMRLNGSATCMAPRRLVLVGHQNRLIYGLEARFDAMEPVFLPDSVRGQVNALLEDARAHGASVVGELGDLAMKPVLVLGGTAEMAVARTDFFAPVLTVLQAADAAEAIRLVNGCEYGLTAAIFGAEAKARKLGARLEVGTVLINDLIVPTADPRVPFGGRRTSGFGVTRGAEGLLEMTAIRTTSVRRGKDRKHLQPTTDAHEELFGGVIGLSHGSGWRRRLAGLKQVMSAIRKLK